MLPTKSYNKWLLTAAPSLILWHSGAPDFPVKDERGEKPFLDDIGNVHRTRRAGSSRQNEKYFYAKPNTSEESFTLENWRYKSFERRFSSAKVFRLLYGDPIRKKTSNIIRVTRCKNAPTEINILVITHVYQFVILL